MATQRSEELLPRGATGAQEGQNHSAHRVTLQRLTTKHGIRRVRRTAKQPAAGEPDRQMQSVSWQARRANRTTKTSSSAARGAGVSAPTPVCQLGYPAVIVPKSP